MTREEAIADIRDNIKPVVGGKSLDMAIASLEAWEKVQQEINDLFSKPPCYTPNYEDYNMFLKIIDKHIKEVEE